MTSKYQVLDTVDHDGKRYEEGDLIELEDGQAEALARAGAISPYPAEMAAPKPTTSGGSRKAKDKPAPDAAMDGGDAQPGGTGEENASGAKE